MNLLSMRCALIFKQRSFNTKKVDVWGKYRDS